MKRVVIGVIVLAILYLVFIVGPAVLSVLHGGHPT